ncbi:hypothetical protein D3C87_1767460 [compost metagenome]
MRLEALDHLAQHLRPHQVRTEEAATETVEDDGFRAGHYFGWHIRKLKPGCELGKLARV